MAISKNVSSGVQDSTDWLGTPLRSLAAVDSALRCQVCKDFYTTPMITSCAHTFCSSCIRRALSNEGKCPTCRTQDQELKLRFNGAMEELVEAFKRARPEIMDFATKPTSVVSNRSPKRPRNRVDDSEEPPRKRTRASQRRAESSSQTVVLDSEEDEDYIPEDGMVICPVCSRRVKEDQINSHLDHGCPDEAQTTLRTTKPTFSNPRTNVEKPIKKPERLAAINYSMYKDSQLKKKLMDQGLSAAGTRQVMEKRYTEWTIIWNANCDATNPRSKTELKKELEGWERVQNAKPSGSIYGSQIKDKDFDGQDWSNTHGDSFKALIAKARQKIATKPQPKAEVAMSSTAALSDTSKLESDVGSNTVVEPAMDLSNRSLTYQNSPTIRLPGSQIESQANTERTTALDNHTIIFTETKDVPILDSVTRLRPL